MAVLPFAVRMSILEWMYVNDSKLVHEFHSSKAVLNNTIASEL